jgi:hypothetical protein
MIGIYAVLTCYVAQGLWKTLLGIALGLGGSLYLNQWDLFVFDSRFRETWFRVS